MSSPSTPLTPRRSQSLRRSWVPYAQDGGVEIQRLSRLAFFERAKNPNRFRIMQNGVIVALYRNKEELQAALESNKTLPSSEPLISQVANQPEDTPRDSRSSQEGTPEPGTSPLVPPTSAFESASNTPRDGARTPTADSASRRSSQTSRRGSHIPRPATPRIDASGNELATTPVHGGMDGVPRNDLGSKMQSRLSNFLKLPSEEKVEYDDQVKQFLTPPRPVDSASPLAAAIEAKLCMTAEELRAHRAKAVKPPESDQEPVLPVEQVITWRYDGESDSWDIDIARVSLAKVPFAEGSMHEVYKMILQEKGKDKLYVAKTFTETAESLLIAPDPNEPDLEVVLQKSAMVHYSKSLPDTDMETKFIENVVPCDGSMTKEDFMAWFRRLTLFKQEVQTQSFCQTYANAFNRRMPPQSINFLPMVLIAFFNHPERVVYACEPYVEVPKPGGLLAHHKDIPQAFAHFSYVHSEKSHLIAGIQSVGDKYTDPMVHSITKKKFGADNLGQKGIDKFFQSHRCNSLCAQFNLS